MRISDLDYLKVISEETSIVGGTASASAKAESRAKAINSGYASSIARTVVVSSPDISFSRSNSKSKASAN